jgi:DNA-binding PadR family transcriptional regulator
LELAILGLLTEQELHGYELKKRLADTLGHGPGVSFGSVSFGSLYPALARLERAGAVKAVEARHGVAPVPPTGSLGGELAAYRARRASTRGTRGKKVYGITPSGRALFEELLSAGAESSDDDRLFNLRLVFAGHLPPDARLGMLERRRIHLLDRLTHIRGRVRAGVDRWDAYGRSLAEHDRQATEHDISWIEQLIARERALAATPTPLPAAAPVDGAAAEPPSAESPLPSAPERADRPSLSGLRAAAPQDPSQEVNPQ